MRLSGAMVHRPDTDISHHECQFWITLSLGGHRDRPQEQGCRAAGRYTKPGELPKKQAPEKDGQRPFMQERPIVAASS